MKSRTLTVYPKSDEERQRLISEYTDYCGRYVKMNDDGSFTVLAFPPKKNKKKNVVEPEKRSTTKERRAQKPKEKSYGA